MWSPPIEQLQNAARRRPGFDRMASAHVGPLEKIPSPNSAKPFLAPPSTVDCFLFVRFSLVVARFAAGRPRFELSFMWSIIA